MRRKRIIIFASERSGTNLLRVLLGRHKEISAPVAVHFFNTFVSSINDYGDLQDSKNSEKLIEHFIASANHPYTDWNLDVSSSEIVKKNNVDSFEKAFDAIYKEYADAENKQHYVVKDNDMFCYVDLLEKLPKNEADLFYIHLYRDPRDHVVSWLKTPLFMHTPYDIAIKWNKEQNKIESLKKRLKVFELSYEELIKDTQEAMIKLLNFLNLEIDQNCFSTDKNNIESNRNKLWKNLSQPIIKDNYQKYRNHLSDIDLKIVEAICSENMEKLNYELNFDGSWTNRMRFYIKIILPFKRKINERKNRTFYKSYMSELKSKLELLGDLRKEIQNA